MKRSTYTLRRLLALVLVLVMVGSLFAGCDKKTEDPTIPEEPSETIEQTAAPTEEPTEAPTEEPTEAPTEPVETVPPVLMGTVNADNLNVRSEPYSTADILKRLAINTRIEILEQKIVDGINWGRVADGWINLNYVSIGVEFPEPGTSTVVNNETNIGTGNVTVNDNTNGTITTGLNIRKESNADSAIVGSYQKGDKITVLERNGNWGRTNKGWINLKYVDFTNSVTGSGSSSGSSSGSGTNSTTVSNGNSVPLGNGTVVKTTSLAIRSGPGANYTQVSYIRKGETHDYFQTSTNGWVRMKKGWVNADYLDLEYYLEDGTEVTVTANELTVRLERDYNSTKLYTYEKGDEITILEVKGTWGMVEYTSGQYGWVDLDKVKLPTPVSSNYSTGIATVTADALHIREKASATSDPLGVLEEGDKVDIIEVNGNWGKFEMDNGDYGWINLKYTKMSTTYTTGTGYITASKLNVREEPDDDSDKIGSLSNGDKVTILDTEGTWGKILYDEDDGEYGWISLKYVRITSASTGSTSTPSSSTKYTVTINRPDNGTVTTSASSYKSGATVTLNATPVSGFKLSSYYVVDAAGVVVSVSGNQFTMPASNVTVTATFVEDNVTVSTYTVSCNPSANVTASCGSTAVAQGTKVALTITPPDGKVLSTLTLTDDYGNTVSYAADYTFTMPASDVNVYATFVAATGTNNVYTITKATSFNPATAHGNITSNMGSATANTTVTLTADPDEGYSLSSITVTNLTTGLTVAVSGSSNTRTFVMPASNVTISAQFTAGQHTVSVASVTGGSAAVNPSACAVGSYVTVTATADDDFHLKHIKVYGPGNVLVDTLENSGEQFRMPAYDVTVEPVFERDDHTITGLGASISAAVSDITLSTTTAKAGQTVTLTMAYPDTRFVVSAVTAKDSNGASVAVSGSGNSWSFVMPAANVTEIKVTYVRQYTVKADVAAILYKEASSASTQLATVPAGTKFIPQSGSDANWMKVTYNNQTGYIHMSAVN